MMMAAALLAAGTGQASAQSGFALKGHYLFNASDLDNEEQTPAADGFSLGAELKLGSIGIGVSGYATGKATEFERESTSFGFVAEANYFINLPVLPITPYVGVHGGLGQYTIDNVDDADPEFEDSRTQLGWQVGARFQLSQMFGLDAQYRRVSESASQAQGGDLERDQVL
ncbi:MAG TPA: outer membrane beta-barrel protein, partial [Longimicrobium sp.]|nr:outer membrane beta-barrel protein [Longimicrobium sp.]